MGGASISSATVAAAVGAGGITAETVTISIPAPVADMLKREAHVRHQSMASVIAEMVREMAEERAAQKALAKAIKANKGKPSIKAEDLYAQCGL